MRRQVRGIRAHGAGLEWRKAVGKRRRLVVAVAVAALGAPLAACGIPARSAITTTTTTSATSGTIVPFDVADQQSARRDVQLFNCNATTDGWSAGGTIQNTQGQEVTYHIVVFFTSQTATDLAYGETTVPLAPGKVTLWSVQPKFLAPDGTVCVLRGVSTTTG